MFVSIMGVLFVTIFVLAHHMLNMGSTCLNIGSTWAQHGLKMPEHGLRIGSTCAQHGLNISSTCLDLGSTCLNGGLLGYFGVSTTP